MPPRIKPKRAVQLFLAQWREKKGLTQQQVADRMDTSDATISRYETGERRPDINAQAAYAEALGLEHFTMLWRDPERPSADDLLRDEPDEVVRQVVKSVEQNLQLIKAARKSA